MVYFGGNEIKGMYFGASAPKAAWFNGELVWGGEEPVPVGDWLCFTAAQANSTVRLDKVGSPGAVSLETSVDGSSWTDYSWSNRTGAALTLAGVGDKVYMRAKNENQTIGSSYSNRY